MVATNAIGDSAVSNTSSAATPGGSPPENGVVQSAVSFFDNADSGYVNLYNTFSKMCVDALQNIFVACYARTGTFTINRPEEDGITQISTLTDTFIDNSGVTQGANTYFTYNLEVIQYNSYGVPQWVAQIGGDTNKGNTIYDIVSDSNSNLYALVGHATSIVTYYHADGTVFGTLNNTFAFGDLTYSKYLSASNLNSVICLSAIGLGHSSIYFDSLGVVYMHFVKSLTLVALMPPIIFLLHLGFVILPSKIIVSVKTPRTVPPIFVAI
jgi:hypothetical protein